MIIILFNILGFATVSIAGLYLNTKSYHILTLLISIVFFLVANNMVDLNEAQKLYPLLTMLGYALTTFPIGLGKVKINRVTTTVSTIIFSTMSIIPLVLMKDDIFTLLVTYLGLSLISGIYFYCYYSNSDLEALRQSPIKYLLHTVTDLIFLYSAVLLALDNSGFNIF